jgi:glycosyltransferase involved in cell wall biosynthesis
MNPHLVSILVPNYKTLELTKLCLRLLRKNTDLNQAKVIVIDNQSDDASLDYLRQVKWIQLIERKILLQETPVQSHSRALDLALDQVDTPFVLSIHTDTLVKHPKWLDFLLSQIKQDDYTAGVGSWKLESKPFFRRLLKNIERHIQLFYFQLIGKSQHDIEGVGKNYYYLRSHCALYRVDLLRRYHLHFSDGDEVAGKSMHQSLLNYGYKMLFIPSERLIPYLDHINHATTILNPELSRKKSVNKGLIRIEKTLQQMNAQAILLDDQLDR